MASRAPVLIEEKGAVETAVALILAPGKSGLEALFIRRAERRGDPWSGHVALPGGRREAADRDRLATAVRETREETGVALTRLSLLGRLDDVHPRTPTLPPIVISPFVFARARRPVARVSDEVAAVFWLPLAELAGSRGRAMVSVRGASTEVDCFLAGDVVIWGLTYRILRGFLPLIGLSA